MSADDLRTLLVPVGVAVGVTIRVAGGDRRASSSVERIAIGGSNATATKQYSPNAMFNAVAFDHTAVTVAVVHRLVSTGVITMQ